MADISKLKDKLDVQKIMGSIKSFVNPSQPIPEDFKNNPLGYRLEEITKIVKLLVDAHVEQADRLTKLSVALGELAKEMTEAAKVGETKEAAGKEKE